MQPDKTLSSGKIHPEFVLIGYGKTQTCKQLPRRKKFSLTDPWEPQAQHAMRGRTEAPGLVRRRGLRGEAWVRVSIARQGEQGRHV